MTFIEYISEMSFIGIILSAFFIILGFGSVCAVIGACLLVSKREKKNRKIEKYNRELAKRYGEDPDLFT